MHATWNESSFTLSSPSAHLARPGNPTPPAGSASMGQPLHAARPDGYDLERPPTPGLTPPSTPLMPLPLPRTPHRSPEGDRARHRGEMEASRNFQLVGDEQLREFQEAIRRTIADRDETPTTLGETHARVRGETEEEFDAAAPRDRDRAPPRRPGDREPPGAERNDIEHRYNESTWVTSSVLDDTAEDSPKRQYERFKGTLLKTRDEQAMEVEALDALAKEFAESRHWAGALPTEPTAVLKNRDAAAERFRN